MPYPVNILLDDVSYVPGIRCRAIKDLHQYGIDKAYQLLGQFLLLGMDEERFLDWLSQTCPKINSGHRNETFTFLKQWCDGNL